MYLFLKLYIVFPFGWITSVSYLAKCLNMQKKKNHIIAVRSVRLLMYIISFTFLLVLSKKNNVEYAICSFVFLYYRDNLTTDKIEIRRHLHEKFYMKSFLSSTVYH